ncbi:hypothetical protein F5141DRAFT_776321 [Pisolithus sp. B1]|nr:hypothetical protein F5141DRAFT_776321 [Pisolithus sp. B1]
MARTSFNLVMGTTDSYRTTPTPPDAQNGTEEDEAIANGIEEGLCEIKETSSGRRVMWSLHVSRVLSVDRIRRCGLHTENNDAVGHVKTTIPSIAILRTTMTKRKSVFTRPSDFHRQLGEVTVFSLSRISEGFSLQPTEEGGADSQNRVLPTTLPEKPSSGLLTATLMPRSSPLLSLVASSFWSGRCIYQALATSTEFWLSCSG